MFGKTPSGPRRPPQRPNRAPGAAGLEDGRQRHGGGLEPHLMCHDSVPCSQCIVPVATEAQGVPNGGQIALPRTPHDHQIPTHPPPLNRPRDVRRQQQ